MTMTEEFWKARLDAGGRQCYAGIQSAFSMRRKTVTLDPVDQTKLMAICCAVLDDHPEYFYIADSASMCYHTLGLRRVSVELTVDEIYGRQETTAMRGVIENVAGELLRKMNGVVSEAEREKLIVDWFLDNISYEVNNVYNQSAGTVLVKRKGQCSGISRAFKLLCDRANVWCIVAKGKALSTISHRWEPHAWNIVRINGEYFHVDVTFMIGSNMDKKRPYFYNYFNLGDNSVNKDHLQERAGAPICLRDGKVPGQEDVKKLTSRAAIVREVSAAIATGKNTLTFLSALPVKSPQEMMNAAMSACSEALSGKRAGAFTVRVSAKGELVTLSW